MARKQTGEPLVRLPASHNDFDEVGRRLIRSDPPGFAHWATGRKLKKTLVFHGFLDTRTIAGYERSSRIMDSILEFGDPEQPWLRWPVISELMSVAQTNIVIRLLQYTGDTTEGLSLDPNRQGLLYKPIPLLVNFTGTAGSEPLIHQLPDDEEPCIIFKPYVLNIQNLVATEILDQVESTDPDINISPIALPFVPLMQGGDDPGIIPRWLDLLVPKAPQGWRESYLAATIVFADLAGRASLWLPPLKEFNMQTSPIVDTWRQEWRQEGRDEGLDEGVDKGRLENAHEYLMGVLEDRLNPPIPQTIVERVQSQKDHRVLRQWLGVALRCDSYDVFEQRTRS